MNSAPSGGDGASAGSRRHPSDQQSTKPLVHGNDAASGQVLLPVSTAVAHPDAVPSSAISKYGSLDQAKAVIMVEQPANATDIGETAQVSSPDPPKPAVRQRVQQRQRTPNNIATAAAAVAAMSRQSAAPNQDRHEHPPERYRPIGSGGAGAGSSSSGRGSSNSLDNSMSLSNLSHQSNDLKHSSKSHACDSSPRAAGSSRRIAAAAAAVSAAAAAAAAAAAEAAATAATAANNPQNPTNTPSPVANEQQELVELGRSASMIEGEERPSATAPAPASMSDGAARQPIPSGAAGTEFNSTANELVPLGASKTAGKVGLALPLPSVPQNYNDATSRSINSEPPVERPYPKTVFFIVANEFCERFSFYGLRTVLVLYFTNVLGFTDSKATVSFHLFVSFCYITPILGAILGDSVFGKFKTIFYLSIVYLIGEIGLVAASILWQTPMISHASTFLGLALIGLGTGGIKPCVCALGGDQFFPHEERRRQGFFSLFYAAINLGSLLSMTLSPMLRSEFYCVNRSDCYPYAFGLPSLLMFVAILLFLAAKNHYVLRPLPENNVLVSFWRCFWLALRRKIAGCRETGADADADKRLARAGNAADSPQQARLALMSDGNSSSSNLSMNSNELPPSASKYGSNPANNTSRAELISSKTRADTGADAAPTGRRHWLYLASDKFDTKSIEDYRTVLSTLVLFIPLPVYWCLFDQQGSLWTLQATRMDGRVFGRSSSFAIQPDQMSVANPLLLILFIPIFECFIYPCAIKCGVLKRPLQRMTVGGIVAALAFVSSAMIEGLIQESTPPQVVAAGRANLLLVNGINECTLVNASLSYVHILPNGVPSIASSPSGFTANDSLAPSATVTQPAIAVAAPSAQTASQTAAATAAAAHNAMVNEAHAFGQLEQLGVRPFELLSNATTDLNNYQLKFRLASSAQSNDEAINGCPFDSQTEFSHNLGPLPDQSTKMLFIEQGNGRLSYLTFNESLELPKPGKARVRLLYEFFGSSSVAERRVFKLSLVSASKQNQSLNYNSSSNADNSSSHAVSFTFPDKAGQVLLSDYVEIPVPTGGERFVLESSDSLLKSQPPPPFSSYQVSLEPGTRNLLVLSQTDASQAKLSHKVLQEDNYRINLMYQLIPYTLISASEVMFSITSLEFSYSMAPDSMKSVVLASMSLTTAFGNILTVAVESLHFFTNVMHDFLFYSTLMLVDIFIFALLGYWYPPRK